MKEINKDLKTIEKYAHANHWLYDWTLLHRLYISEPDTYSLFTPFAFSYLEELIRSTTSKYSLTREEMTELRFNRVYGTKIINCAIKENKGNKELVKALEDCKQYYLPSEIDSEKGKRNSVMHGYLPPLYWSKDSFEVLIHKIAEISRYSNLKLS